MKRLIKWFLSLFQKRKISTSAEAFDKLAQIIKDANPKGWVPDWNDYDQDKFVPWFCLSEDPGFALLCVDSYCTVSAVPARLCFADREVAKKIVTKHIDLYRIYITGK